MRTLDKAEDKYINEMISTYRQLLTSKSWKHRRDLRKCLTKMEKELIEYQKNKSVFKP